MEDKKIQSLEELRALHPYRKKSDGKYDYLQTKTLEAELGDEIEHCIGLPKSILKLILGDISKEKYLEERLTQDSLKLKKFWLARSEYESTRDYVYYRTSGRSDDMGGIAYASRSESESMEFKKKCQEMARFYQKMASLVGDE